MALTVETCWIFLSLFRDVYTSVPKGVQQSFSNLSFNVCRNQGKNLQNNHFPNATAFSSVYTKVLSASALSETSSYQSNFDCPQFPAFCQTGGKEECTHQSSTSPPYCLKQFAWGLAGLEAAEGGESKAPACSNSARLAWQRLEGLSTSASQALSITGSKRLIHFSLWPLLLWGREEKQR